MTYTAFISYTGDSGLLALRLHRELERYTIPKGVRYVQNGVVTKSTGKFFLDRAELSASPHLKKDIEKALEKSKFLIVLCTPDAAKSTWVPLEIEYYKNLGRSDNIIPVLAGGDPAVFDAEIEPTGAFPPELFDDRTEYSDLPLAPDLREIDEQTGRGGDGFETALLRILARLLGIGYPELTQRHLVAERDKRRLRNRIISALSILLVLTFAGGWTAWLQKEAADRRLAQALDSATRQVQMASGFRDRYGIPSSVPEELFSGAASDFARIVEEAGHNPNLLLQRARYSLGMAVLAADTEGGNDTASEYLANARDDIERSQHLSEKWYSRIWFRDQPDPAAILREQVNVLDIAAKNLAIHSQSNAATALATKAQILTNKLANFDVGEEYSTFDTVFSLCSLSDIYYHLGERLQAQENYSTCLSAAEQLWEREQTEENLTLMIRALIDYGMIARLEPDQLNEALSMHRRANEMASAGKSRDLVSNDKRLLIVEAQVSLADTLNLSGAGPDEQMKVYSDALNTLTDLVESDQNRKDWKLLSTNILYRVAGLQAREAATESNIQKMWDSEANLTQGVRLLKPLVRRFPEDISLARTLSALFESRAEVYVQIWLTESDTEKISNARADLSEMLEVRQRLTKGHQDRPVLSRDLANAYLTSARLRAQMEEELDQIRLELSQARTGFLKLSELPEMQPMIGRDLALTDYVEAKLLAKYGIQKEACALTQRAYERLTTLIQVYPRAKKLRDEAKTVEKEICREEIVED